MSKILIVGGSGFIGSHVADKLTNGNHEVVLYDVIDSPYKSKNQEMIIGNNLDTEKLYDILKTGIDYVYNFSSIADINAAKNNFNLMIDVNLKSHLNLMEACASTNVNRYIYSSSLYVYSNYGSLYKASKQSAELFIEAFNELNKLDFTIVRCGTVYGPRAQEWNGFYQLIKRVVRDKQLIFDGSGDEIRYFIHVEDVAELFVKVLDEEYINEFVTINGSEKYSGKDLVKLIENIFEDNINKSLMKFKGTKRPDHYVVTPYKYFPKKSKHITKDSYIELGQGILDLAHHIKDTL
jgi:UDP-glucose 4-epimerase|tara:strand:- start:1646 stop:2527 length:882 start_codon:yes stop_codon:yes gene_type:complete